MSELIGIRAERVALPVDTVVRAGDGYVVVETPSQRGFHDGNVLVLDPPVELADIPRWVEVFRREFAGAAGIEHVGVWWEIDWAAEPTSVAAALREATDALGLGHEFHEVLELATPTAPPRTAPVEVRPVEGHDWSHVVELATGFGEGIPRSFWEWRVGAFRSTSEVRGGGHWLAWQDDEPVATAGLYHHGGLGTVQDVITRQDHRGRGIAGTLLHTALQSVPGDTRTVIVVEPDTTAASLYRRLGFRPHSHLLVVKQRATT